MIRSRRLPFAVVATTVMTSAASATCPATYGGVVLLEHKPDYVNSVVLSLQPTHQIQAPVGPYDAKFLSPESDNFELYANQWFRYFDVYYQAHCNIALACRQRS